MPILYAQVKHAEDFDQLQLYRTGNKEEKLIVLRRLCSWGRKVCSGAAGLEGFFAVGTLNVSTVL